MYSTVQYCTVVDMMHVTVCMMGSTEISERLCHIMCATVLLYLGYTKVLHASHPCMAEINSYQHRNEIATGLVMSVSFMSYPLVGMYVHTLPVHVGGIRDFCNYSKNHFLVKIDSIIVIYVQFYVHRHIPIYSYNCITSFKIVNRLRQICQKKVSGHLSFCR